MTDTERLRARLDIVAQVHRLLKAGAKPPFRLLTDGAGHYLVTL